jgi:fucose 4-O-acetylase-like acetyltransferase
MAKGIGILLVILGHLNEYQPLWDGAVHTWIYSFHMPLFFFLSGYVFTSKYEFGNFFEKKFESIVVPYFSLGLVIIIFYLCFNHFQGNLDSFTTFYLIVPLLLNLLIQRRFWDLWYISCLFVLELVFYVLVKKLPNLKYVFGVAVSMLTVGLLYYHFGRTALPWNIDAVFTSIIFFFVGYWFKLYYQIIRSKMNRIKVILLFLLMCIINILFAFLNVKISGNGLQMYASTYGFPPFMLLSSFSGIICVVIISHFTVRQSRNRICIRAINYIGRNSLLYYAWHKTIMIPIMFAVFDYIGLFTIQPTKPIALICVHIIELFILLILCTICNICISKSKIRFMIGR